MRLPTFPTRCSFAISMLAAWGVVAAGPARADVWVTSFLTDSVLRYDDSGAFVGEFVASGSGGLDDPRGIVFSPFDGTLLIASSATDSVLRYDGSTGAFLGAFVTSGSGGLDNPFDLSFGPDLNLYVASTSTSEVLRYEGRTGAFIDVFAASGTPELNTPRGMAFGNGNLWVSGEGDRVWRFDATTGAHTGSFVADNPRGLTIGPGSNLYVSTNVSNQVNCHDGTTGAFLEILVEHDSGGLSSPMGLVFHGPEQDLFVCSRTTDSILRYDGETGDFLGEFVASGSGGLNDPHFFTFGECRTPTAYCVSAPNSAGPGAVISYAGSSSVAANDFALVVDAAPPDKFALFAYGPEQVSLPFGDGFQCIGRGALEIFRFGRPVLTNDVGHAERRIDLDQPPANSGPGEITPGSIWNFQVWYRDPAGPGGTGFNASNALSAVFCP